MTYRMTYRKQMNDTSRWRLHPASELLHVILFVTSVPSLPASPRSWPILPVLCLPLTCSQAPSISVCHLYTAPICHRACCCVAAGLFLCCWRHGQRIYSRGLPVRPVGISSRASIGEMRPSMHSRLGVLYSIARIITPSARLCLLLGRSW